MNFLLSPHSLQHLVSFAFLILASRVQLQQVQILKWVVTKEARKSIRQDVRISFHDLWVSESSYLLLLLCRGLFQFTTLLILFLFSLVSAFLLLFLSLFSFSLLSFVQRAFWVQHSANSLSVLLFCFSCFLGPSDPDVYCYIP